MLILLACTEPAPAPPRFAELAVDAERLELGAAEVGQETTAYLTVSNVGDAPFQLVGVDAAPPFHAAASADFIPAQGSRRVEVTFRPDSRGQASETLRIDTTIGDAWVELVGTGLGPILDADDVGIGPTPYGCTHVGALVSRTAATPRSTWTSRSSTDRTSWSYEARRPRSRAARR